MKEQSVGFWRKVMGEAGTDDIQQHIQNLAKDIQRLNTLGETNVANARTPQAVTKARNDWEKAVQDRYDWEQNWEKDQHKAAVDAAKGHSVTVQNRTEGPQQVWVQENTAARQKALEGYGENLAYQQAFVGKESLNTNLTGRKDALTAAHENAGIDRPYENALKNLDAEISSIIGKIAVIGKPESFKVMAEAAGEARKEITKLNEELDKRTPGAHLTPQQEAAIQARYETEAAAKATLQWGEALQSTKTSTDERVRSLNMLAAAIGEGYEATKKANVETQVMSAMREKYTNPAYAEDADRLRRGFGAEFDARHNEQVAASIDKLQQQTEVEKALAAVQAQGAEAVRLVTLQYRLDEIAKNNDAATTKRLQQAEIDLYSATRANHSAETIAKINDETQALKNLTAAAVGGADQIRRARLGNEIAAMGKEGGTAVPGIVGVTQEQLAAAGQEQAKHEQEVSATAGKLVTTYADQLRLIQEQVEYIQKNSAAFKDQLGVAIALRDLENQRLQIAAQMELKQRGAVNGLKAFFLEMQQNARSAADIVYDSLNSALDRVSDQFGKLFTGQKTSWGKAFQGLGEDMVKESTKSLMQKGLGQLGKMFGIDLPAGKPDGSTSKPFHVIVDGQGQQSVPGAVSGSGGLFGGGSWGLGGIFSMLGGLGSKIGGGLASLFGGGGSALAESVTSSISFRATGGDVEPGKGYVVGDGGEPEFFSPKTAGTITPLSKLVSDLGTGKSAAELPSPGKSALTFMADGGDVDPGKGYVVGDRGEPEFFSPRTAGRITPLSKMGMGDNHTYYMDFRGAGVGVENHVRQAIAESHNAAVVASVRANADRSRRS